MKKLNLVSKSVQLMFLLIAALASGKNAQALPRCNTHEIIPNTASTDVCGTIRNQNQCINSTNQQYYQDENGATRLSGYYSCQWLNGACKRGAECDPQIAAGLINDAKAGLYYPVSTGFRNDFDVYVSRDVNQGFVCTARFKFPNSTPLMSAPNNVDLQLFTTDLDGNQVSVSAPTQTNPVFVEPGVMEWVVPFSSLQMLPEDINWSLFGCRGTSGAMTEAVNGTCVCPYEFIEYVSNYQKTDLFSILGSANELTRIYDLPHSTWRTLANAQVTNYSITPRACYSDAHTYIPALPSSYPTSAIPVQSKSYVFKTESEVEMAYFEGEYTLSQIPETLKNVHDQLIANAKTLEEIQSAQMTAGAYPPIVANTVQAAKRLIQDQSMLTDVNFVLANQLTLAQTIQGFLKNSVLTGTYDWLLNLFQETCPPPFRCYVATQPQFALSALVSGLVDAANVFSKDKQTQLKLYPWLEAFSTSTVPTLIAGNMPTDTQLFSYFSPSMLSYFQGVRTQLLAFQDNILKLQRHLNCMDKQSNLTVAQVEKVVTSLLLGPDEWVPSIPKKGPIDPAIVQARTQALVRNAMRFKIRERRLARDLVMAVNEWEEAFAAQVIGTLAGPGIFSLITRGAMGVLTRVAMNPTAKAFLKRWAIPQEFTTAQVAEFGANGGQGASMLKYAPDSISLTNGVGQIIQAYYSDANCDSLWKSEKYSAYFACVDGAMWAVTDLYYSMLSLRTIARLGREVARPASALGKMYASAAESGAEHSVAKVARKWEYEDVPATAEQYQMIRVKGAPPDSGYLTFNPDGWRDMDIFRDADPTNYQYMYISLVVSIQSGGKGTGAGRALRQEFARRNPGKNFGGTISMKNREALIQALTKNPFDPDLSTVPAFRDLPGQVWLRAFYEPLSDEWSLAYFIKPGPETVWMNKGEIFKSGPILAMLMEKGLDISPYFKSP